jgi:lysozyme
MAFNLGITKLLGFRNTLVAMRQGKYDAAADGMLASAWAAQVKGRAQRLADMMRKGV